MSSSSSLPALTSWQRLRKWFRPPRRLHLQQRGTILIAGVFGLGIATLNTGNNLLYLLVGSLLGLIALSGWLSEKTISGLRVERRVGYGSTAGEPVRIEYRIQNRKRRLASAALELREAVLLRERHPAQPVLERPAFASMIAAGERAHAVSVLRLPQRGVYHFQRLTLATSFPFGLFIKERDLQLPGTLVVWPRTDRPVRAVRVGGRRGARREAGAGAALGAERGDYRGLRPYRAGDDPRDVHWRTSARRQEPIVREYDRDSADSYWIVLDLGAPDEASGEAAVDTAAALAARAAENGDRFGFAAGDAVIPAGAQGAPLDAVLDVLARVELRPGASFALPAPSPECVLVTAGAPPAGRFADVVFAAAAEEDAA